VRECTCLAQAGGLQAACRCKPHSVTATATATVIDVVRSDVAAHLDGGARTIDVHTHVGALGVDVSFHDGQSTRRTTVDLPGVTADMHLDEAAASLAIDDLSLGPRSTTVKVDNQTILTLDFNRDARRSANLGLRLVGGGALEVAVSPSLELRVRIALSALLGPDAGWAGNETLTVRLDGHSSPTVRSHGDGLLEIVAGRMTYTSTARPGLGFTAHAGECIAGGDYDDFDDDESHPFEALEVTTCE